MKFSCIREKLDYALTTAERFTGKNISLPTLGSILFHLRGGTLTIAATNLEYAIEMVVSGSGEGEERICVPAKISSAFIQSLKDDTIDVEAKNTHLVLKSGARITRINCLTADEFPLIPSLKKHTGVVVSSSLLREGLEKVLPAVSLSGFKPELNGVLFRAGKQSLTLAATDTFRLTEKTITLAKGPADKNFSFILPSRAASEIMRVLRDGEESEIWIDENQALFSIGNTKIVSRLIDGVFPEYEGIVPKNFGTTSIMQRNEIKDSIRTSGIFSSKLQDVILRFQESHVEVSSQNQEVGEYRTKIPSSFSGNPVTVSFNYRYILDGLNALHEDEIFFGCNDENAPALLRNKSDNSFIYVVMPIRTV